MVIHTNIGLYCPSGDFYIDPMKSVSRAIITHAHSDHARRGMKAYLCHRQTTPLLRARLGKNLLIEDVEYNETRTMNGVHVSLHPAGHVAGSAQVRIEHRGEVCVASGDYKRDSDPFASPFEVVNCHTFITESTFGLPVYRWPSQDKTIEEINQWWKNNSNNGQPSIINAYSLGKAQHILGSIDRSIGPVYVHSAVMQMNEAMIEAGFNVPHTSLLNSFNTRTDLQHALIITPSVADGPDWMQEDGAFEKGRASGWFAVRRAGRRQPDETGFILSDHADWPALVQTVRETECERVLVNHGCSRQLAHYLSKNGLQADSIERPKIVDNEEHDWKPSSIYHKYLEEHTGLDHWLIEECKQHVGNLAETIALLLPRDTEIPVSFGKRMISQINNYRTSDLSPKRSPLRPGRSSREIDRPLIDNQSYHSITIHAVLMHVHLKTGGRRGFAKLTMGVWLDGELVPLVHVPPIEDTAVLADISEHVTHKTIVRNGPVRTVEPRFVFEVMLAGAQDAPRRKCKVAFSDASIVNIARDIEPESAATLDEVVRLAGVGL